MVAKRPDGPDYNNDSPEPRGTVARIELCLPALVTLTGDENGIWVVHTEGNLAADATTAIRRAFRDLSAAQNPLVGLLIDLRDNRKLSIVRLSDLLDELSVLDVRIAVLFDDEYRCQLAQVLYGTLVDKRRVAYFTAYDQAYAFAAGDGEPPDDATPHDAAPDDNSPLDDAPPRDTPS